MPAYTEVVPIQSSKPKLRTTFPLASSIETHTENPEDEIVELTDQTEPLLPNTNDKAANTEAFFATLLKRSARIVIQYRAIFSVGTY
jgi:hypothetical protein